MLPGNVKRYKSRLEANDLTQKRGIDYYGIDGSFWIRATSKGCEI